MKCVDQQFVSLRLNIVLGGVPIQFIITRNTKYVSQQNT